MSAPLSSVLDLQHSEDLREDLRAADVVMAHDHDGREWFIHGKDALHFVISIDSPQPLRVLTLSLDSRTDEWEYLIAAVCVLKGVKQADCEEGLA